MEGPFLQSAAVRAGRLMVIPTREWALLAENLPSKRFVTSYAALLITLPPVILVALGLMGIGFTNVAPGGVLLIGLAGLAATALLLLLTAALVRWIANALDGSADFARAFAFAIFATTPVWLSAAIGNLIDPIQNLLAVIAALWAVVLIAIGATSFLGVPAPKRGVFTYAVAIGMLLIWIVLLGILYAVIYSVLGENLSGRIFPPR